MFDYTIIIEYQDGSSKRYGYQAILKALDMGGALYMGRPMRDGGAPQVQAFVGILKDQLKAVRITAEYNGAAILAA